MRKRVIVEISGSGYNPLLRMSRATDSPFSKIIELLKEVASKSPEYADMTEKIEITIEPLRKET